MIRLLRTDLYAAGTFLLLSGLIYMPPELFLLLFGLIYMPPELFLLLFGLIRMPAVLILSPPETGSSGTLSQDIRDLLSGGFGESDDIFRRKVLYGKLVLAFAAVIPMERALVPGVYLICAKNAFDIRGFSLLQQHPDISAPSERLVQLEVKLVGVVIICPYDILYRIDVFFVFRPELFIKSLVPDIYGCGSRIPA